MLFLVSTGTGNTLLVAREAAAAVPGARVVLREHATAGELEAAQGLVLCCPTHGFTAPWGTIRAAWTLPPGRGRPAAALTTRGSLVLGGVQVPGVSGSAPWLLAALLAWRGYRPRGVAAIDMPSNWWALHPPQRALAWGRIHSRALRRARRFGTALAAGRPVWLTPWNLYEAAWAVLLAPISAAYLAVGRRWLASLFFADERCTGCGACAAACPDGAIDMSEGRPRWTLSCESCMRCATACPTGAVQAAQGWGLLLTLLALAPVAAWPLEGPVLWLAALVWSYPSLLVGSRAFETLARRHATRRLLSATTLTTRWGRYRAVSLGELTRRQDRADSPRSSD